MAANAETAVAATPRTGRGFKADRSVIRKRLVELGIAAELDEAVERLLQV